VYPLSGFIGLFCDKQKGAVMKTLKRIFLIAVAMMLIAFSFGCSFNFTTATITSAIMTDSIDIDGIPGDEVASFAADAPMLYTSAILQNAPDHTQIRIVWAYVTGKQVMDEVTLDSGTISDRYIYSNFEPSALLPEGDYRVDYFIDDHEIPDATVAFTVTAAEYDDTWNEPSATAGAVISEAHMTSYMDENGVPVDSIEVVPTTGTWYVSVILSNTQADTILHFVWYNIDGSVIDVGDVDPQGATDVYIYSTLQLSGAAPEGQYYVGVFINDATEPAAAVSFTASDNA